jgi:hypothetical protein
LLNCFSLQPSEFSVSELVAWEGSAPPTSGCRPDVILFHHQAKIGCRGWICTNISAFKGRCPTIRRPGKLESKKDEGRSMKEERHRARLFILHTFSFLLLGWWPARVTLPVQRIKSPLHHFNACRPKMGACGRIRTCTGDALDVVPLWWPRANVFELRARWWPPAKARNAVDLRHTPHSGSALFSKQGACARPPGPLVRLTFQNGARGRTCTCTVEGLGFVPLPWATRAANWCSRSELH